MQAIAAEMNLSETAFFAPDPAGGGLQIRWFTPSREVDLIGHATLAAGHLVFERLEPEATCVRFLSAGAELIVSRGEVGKGPMALKMVALKMLALKMPALRPRPVAAPPGLAPALGREPVQVLAAKHYLCIYAAADEVRDLRPDMALLSALDLPAVIVTAPAADEVDFVSRFFAPANGVPEDPVSGVAHLCLAPYWSERLGKRKLTGRQLSQRGGLVHCEDLGAQVELSGNAVIVLEGRLKL
jgi:predicted PhzF superfamily epimerase YddE/YHI9